MCDPLYLDQRSLCRSLSLSLSLLLNGNFPMERLKNSVDDSAGSNVICSLTNQTPRNIIIMHVKFEFDYRFVFQRINLDKQFANHTLKCRSKVDSITFGEPSESLFATMLLST